MAIKGTHLSLNSEAPRLTVGNPSPAAENQNRFKMLFFFLGWPFTTAKGNTPKMQAIYKCNRTVNQQLEAEATSSIKPVPFILIGLAHFHLKSLNYHTSTSSRSAHQMCVCRYPSPPATKSSRYFGPRCMAFPLTSCLLKATVLQHAKRRGSRVLHLALI